MAGVSRRALVLLFGGFFANPRQGKGEAKPDEKKWDVPDEFVKKFAEPFIDDLNKDDELLARTLNQYMRVMGRQKMMLLSYRMMLIMTPEVKNHPFILRQIRKRMGV